jgi:xylose isomerase
MIGFFSEHMEINRAIWNLVDKLDRVKYRTMMHEEKHMDLMKLVRKEIYKL